jgi:phosphoribosyl-AMP cyclohydrolase / phosphoribosyl-ATP pyrophosphohydrolase
MKKAYADFNSDAVDWEKGNGLVPAIVQDCLSLRVLMLGYVSRESLKETLSKGLVTFYSRSKKRLWQKGETSGHVLRVRDIKLDCDKDTLLILAEPEGPACHLGTRTCFGEDEKPSLATLADLAAVIKDRHKHPVKDSYTEKLFEAGVARIAQKVGEEGVETALAAATGSPALTEEAADLLYHLLVLLEASGVDWLNVMKVLHGRAVVKTGK